MGKIGPQHANDDDVFTVNHQMCSGIVRIDSLVMEVVPPGVSVIPVINRLLRVEFDVNTVFACCLKRLVRLA